MADFYSYRPLPKNPQESRSLFIEMADTQKLGGANYLQFTIVSDEYPKPPYPNGLYTQGWIERPEVFEFEYPLENFK